MVSLRGCDPGFVARDQETNRLFLDSPVGLRGTSLAPYFGHGCRHRAHPYSTAKNGARIVVDKRSLWQRKALKGSRLRLLIWGVLAAFLVVVLIILSRRFGRPRR